MAILAQHVIKPLVTTDTASASTLTLATSRELKQATFEFMSAINIASEALNDKVLLIMPLEDNDGAGTSGTTTMEASVSRWTKQIREGVDETLTDWIEETGLHDQPHLLSITDYWMSRATKLSDVNAQLMGSRAKRVVALLEKAKSPCLDGFNTVTQKLGRALCKASEMSGYMSHLRPLFRELVSEDTGFGEELTSLFRPVMHTLMLIWKLHPHNTHFNKSTHHLMEILSAIQDALVKQAQQYIGSIVALLNGDATEGLEMLTNVQYTLAAFKNVCFEYSSCIAAECSQDKAWNLTSNAINNKGVFGTIDQFMTRCHSAQNICKAALSFARLEKIDIGGEDGELLTKHARSLHAEFVFLLAQLRAANNGKEEELLNPHSKEGGAVFVEFRERQRLLEKRLSVLLGTAMTDGDSPSSSSSSSSVATILRIYKGFEGLVEHSAIISQDMEARLEKVLRQFVSELLDVRTTFDRDRRLPPLPRGAAPQSGSLMWARSLMHRVEGPMQELKELPCSKVLFESADGQEVVRLYNALVHSVMEFECQLLQQWIHFASESSIRSLSQPVLAYQKEKESAASSPPSSSFGSIIVNFDPALMQLVQEVDGFLHLQPLQRDIPEPILKLHSNAGSLRQHVSSLNWVASVYIDLKKGLTPVEAGLLHPRLHVIDQLIATCLKGELTWQSADLAEISGQLSQGAHSVAAGLAATRSAINKIKGIAGNWQQGWNLLLSFSNGNYSSYNNGGHLYGNKMLVGVQASALTELNKRRMAIQSDVDYIRGLLDSLRSELKELTPSSPAWQGFLNSVSIAMGYDMTAAATAAIHSLLPSSPQQGAEQQMMAVLEEATNTLSPSSLVSLPGRGVKILLDIDPGEDRTIHFVPPIFLQKHHQLRPTSSTTTAAIGSIKQSGKSLESVVNICISAISSMGDSIYQLHHHHGGGDVNKQGGGEGEEIIDGEQRVTFGEVIQRDPKIAAAKEWATAQLKVVADQGHQVASQFDRYTFLWEEDMLQVLDNFVALNSITHDSCGDPDRQAQSFKAFEVEIAKYNAIQSEIQQLPSVVNYGWIAIDCSQVKQAALMAASKWTSIFLEHLRSHIVDNVHRAYSFIEQASTTLKSSDNDATATVPSSRRGSIAARSSNRITQSPGLGNDNTTSTASLASQRQLIASIQHGSRQSLLSGGGTDGPAAQESSSRGSRLGNQGSQRPSTVKRASSSLSGSKRQSVNDGSSDLQTKRRSSTLTHKRSGSTLGTLGQGNNRQSVVVGTAFADRQTSTSGRKSSVVLSAKPVLDPQQKELYDVLSCMREVKTRKEELTFLFEPLSQAVTVLKKLSNNSSCGGGGAVVAAASVTGISLELQQQIQEGPAKLRSLEKKALKKREELASLRAAESIDVRRRADRFVKQLEVYRTFLLKKAPFDVPNNSTTKEPAAVVTTISDEHVSNATGLLVALEETGMDGCPSLVAFEEAGKEIHNQQELLELSLSDFAPLTACRDDLTQLRELWTVVSSIISLLQGWSGQPWKTVNIEILQEEIKKMMKEVKTLPKKVKSWAVFVTLETMLREAQEALPLIADLSHPAMRPRHWGMLAAVTTTASPSVAFTVPVPTTPLGYLLSLNIHKNVETVADVVDRAQKELAIEKALDKIESTWNSMTVKFDHASPLLGAVALTPAADKVPLLVVDVTIKESLENDALTLQTMSSGRYVQGHPVFSQMVEKWQRLLADVDVVTSTWEDVQKRWQAMRAIFGGSADIRKQIPEQCVRFDKVDKDFKSLMSSAAGTVAATAAHTKADKILDVCSVEGRLKRLQWQLMELESCEKALQNYLETKRIAFPRFYFMSPSNLLDLLARGADPHAVTHHLSKIFDNLHALEWQKDSKTGKPINVAVGMYSGEKEYVPFAEPCKCDGPVELWLGSLVHAMKHALKSSYRNAMLEYEEMPRTDWIFKHPAQTAVIASRTHFTNEIEQAFAELEDGNEEALPRALERQKTHLSQLIEVINGDMSKNDRKKAITLCTIDVHARDVLSRLIENRSESSDSFQWQSQLRYVTDENTGDCKVLICDAEVDYQYEYIGNCGCLCITPLTDRCYITLTQAQKLIMGGAPAGPAGTGKTETTKDLARALGLQCYVFNCSDQMDYKAMGQIYKGLAQTGAWGCFDEFNRIPVSVLSVCSTQYKSVLDALRAKKDKFMFEGHQIALKPSAMAFITMNPGYAGRAELPESLKALFRPVSMAAPDLSLICEIMLMAEGFQSSRILARKFIILYRLCEDLLSKAQHYDWKLRAIKTTLYVAGGMKRAAPHLSEEKVLFRALRDFNLGKLTQDDAPVFLGLLNDLFPKTLELVPRAVDMPFDAAIKEAALELGYRPDPTFCLKVGQLREIFSVRWSVFLLGPAGAGKTAIWKTLARAQEKVGEKTVFKIINPKAVTTDELYGSLHPTTREWREGLLSSTFRDFAAASSSTTTAAAGSGGSAAAPKHQWIILDGDIDPEWIESMNTVMDDNKMLTLASNERIPLTSSMKLLLEINHMKHCSPATVTRGGVIYVDADDVGWKPVADSWVEKLWCKKDTKATLNTLLAKYVESTLEFVKKMCNVVVELPAVNQVQTLCKLMDSMMKLEEKQQQAQDVNRKLLEAQFVYACVWALGGNVTAECRSVFSNWWITTFKTVPFPGIASASSTGAAAKTRSIGTAKQPRISSSVISGTSTPPPGGETVFDYFLDEESSEMLCWSSRLPTVKPAITIEDIFVPTIQTAALNNVLSLLIQAGHNTMLVGGAGSGKTAMINQQLQSINAYDILQHSVHLNSHLTGPALQQNLELSLEKRVGTRYGASGNRRMLYFLKGLNMLKVDKYETQTALELVRQSIDSGGWYGKPSSSKSGGGNKVTFKEIQSLQYVATMNPSSGSFTVTPRVQRQFATFAVHMPGAEELKAIFRYILEDHFTTKHGFKDDIIDLVRSSNSIGAKGVLLEAVVDLHQAVVAAFPPSAVNFTYQFTLREISGVVRGLCRANAAVMTSPEKLLRLWTHESDRVYGDRMADVGDKAKYEGLRRSAGKKAFSGIVKSLVDIEAKPLLFADFMHVKINSAEDDGEEENVYKHGEGVTASGGQTAAVSSIRVYEEVSDYDSLHKILYKFMGELSSDQQKKNGATTSSSSSVDHQDNRQHNLVLFPEASQHVVAIARALSTGQHPLLIGPGGSGRQSLARLAAKVAGFEAVSLASAADYALPQFITDLMSVYQKTGVKNIPCALILTDSQLSHDSMLVPLNDLLATAEHAGLCSNSEDKDAICAAVKNEARAAGMLDTPAQLWGFFLSRVRANLRIVLCASPVGDKLRVWARRFPALMSSMAFDTFGGWPRTALCAVSQKLLLENNNSSSIMSDGNMSAGPLVLDKSQVESVSEAAAAIHEAVAAACVKYWAVYRRRAYVTPKSFLELISLYNQLLKQKRKELKNAKLRLQNGVFKISEARSAVLLLQKELEKEQVVVEEKKAAAAALVESLGVEKAAADVAVESGKGNEAAAVAIQEEVSSAQLACAADLEKAEPIIKEAEAALNSLDKASLGELKSFSKPAPDIVAVVAACMVLTAPVGKPVKDLSWPAAKRWMGDVNALLRSLTAFDKDNVPVAAVDRVEHEFVTQQGFQPDLVRTKSFAAAGLCSWVINICKYSRIYAIVAPKRAALAEANSRLDDSNRRLAGARSYVAGLLSKVAALQDELDAATAAKNAAIAQAEKTASKAALAEKLVSGLAGEYVRWQASIEALAKQEETIVGDALLSAAFVAYAGTFNTPLRRELVNQHWLPQIQKKNIPIATATSCTSGKDGIENMHSKGDGNSNNCCSGEEHGLDGLSLVLEFLITARDKACWIQEGLPTDSHSQENAAIVGLCTSSSFLTSSESSKPGGRWPLLIDPQLQGAKWVAAKEGGHGLITTRLTANGYLDAVGKAVETGVPLLIENLPEELDPVLLPLLTRQLVNKGGFKYVNIGGTDIRYNASFRLYLQTRLAAPHYGPEVAAQITLINFCVTKKGLESQLLGAVVGHERPELQQQASILSSQLAEYSITLKSLEDKLLAGLAASKGDILEDMELIQSLEQTKATAVEVATKVQQAQVTGARLTAAREVFRPVAARGAAMYFIMDSLPLLNRVYCYSMASFMQLLKRGMDACSGGGRQSNDRDEVEEGDDTTTATTASVMESYSSGEDIQAKVARLTKSITASFYSEVCQGLFEKHKLSVAVQLAFTVLKERGELSLPKWTYLLKGSSSPTAAGSAAALNAASYNILAPEWLQRGGAWARLLALSMLEGFSSIPQETTASGSKRWKEWMECSLPEEMPLPGEWKRASHLDKLLILKAFRPDRLAPALYNFVALIIGQQYATPPTVSIQVALNHASPSIPVLFFLSPGVDIAGAVEAATKQGNSNSSNSNSGQKSKAMAAAVAEQRSYATVSLGQGQEELAMAALKKAREHGGWVLLQNIHLTIDWTLTALSRFIDALDVGSDAGGGGGSQDDDDTATTTTNNNNNAPHPDFRLLLSAEPPPSLEQSLPTSLLQACIKVANEPPRGLKANLLRSLSLLDEDLIEGCSRPGELKAIMFALSFFHAAILERKRFGVGNRMSSKSGLGWNMDYPFSAGDLRCCVAIAANALENASVGGGLPWEDMRYMFGDIMYGGHIVENWDRRLVGAYLESIFNDGLLLPGAEVFPGLALPPASAFSSSGGGGGGVRTAVATAMRHVEKNMPAENPRAFGLNQNAAITCLLAEASSLCDDLVVLAPESSSDDDDTTTTAAAGGTSSTNTTTNTKEQTTANDMNGSGLQAMLVEDILRRLPEAPSADDIRSRTGDSSGAPFAAVLLQECQALHTLILKIKSNLGELESAINGQLTMTLQLEVLAANIADDVVPQAWLTAAGSPSLRSLSSWIDQLGNKAAQLDNWALTDPAAPPKSVWLGGLSNPQAFLTAVLQTAARRNGWALDRTALVTEVTRKTAVDQIDGPPRDGAYVHGLWLEGASWDDGAGSTTGGGGGALMDGRPGELICQIPILLLKAVPVEKAELKDVYECPVYWTQCRFRQEVFTAQLKTKQSWMTWTKAGVAMFLDVGGR
jgi:dynein heavy chain, axonemal